MSRAAREEAAPSPREAEERRPRGGGSAHRRLSAGIVASSHRSCTHGAKQQGPRTHRHPPRTATQLLGRGFHGRSAGPSRGRSMPVPCPLRCGARGTRVISKRWVAQGLSLGGRIRLERKGPESWRGGHVLYTLARGSGARHRELAGLSSGLKLYGWFPRAPAESLQPSRHLQKDCAHEMLHVPTHHISVRQASHTTPVVFWTDPAVAHAHVHGASRIVQTPTSSWRDFVRCLGRRAFSRPSCHGTPSQ